MTDWLERLMGGTRARLLDLLRDQDRTVSDLADELGVSGNAVRGHVAALQRDGLVRAAGVRRDTGGKPARLYRITPGAEELYPKAYAYVLGELLEAIEDEGGAERVEALLARIAERAAERIDARGDAEARVAAAVSAVESLGGELAVERIDGGWRLQGRGCPLSGLVDAHPALCRLVRTLIEEIVDLPVGECCEREESSPRCRFVVTR